MFRDLTRVTRDTGNLALSDGGMIEIIDTQSYAGFILHVGVVKKGTVRVGDAVTCKVDYERRRKIAPNHSMTHVLNFALRTVLGDDVSQKGSLVDESKLRYVCMYMYMYVVVTCLRRTRL